MAIAFTKEVATFDAAESVATITVTVPAAGVAQGNLLSLAVITETDTTTVSGVTDTQGNAYTVGETQQITAGDTFRVTEVYGVATTALVSGNTIVATISSAGFDQKKMKVLEFSGTSATPNDGSTSAKDDVFPRALAFANLDSGPITPTDVAGIAVGHCGYEQAGVVDNSSAGGGTSVPPGGVYTMRGSALTGGLSNLVSSSVVWTGLGATSIGPADGLIDHYFGTTIRAFKVSTGGGPPPDALPPVPSAARTFYVG